MLLLLLLNRQLRRLLLLQLRGKGRIALGLEKLLRRQSRRLSRLICGAIAPAKRGAWTCLPLRWVDTCPVNPLPHSQVSLLRHRSPWSRCREGSIGKLARLVRLLLRHRRGEATADLLDFRETSLDAGRESSIDSLESDDTTAGGGFLQDRQGRAWVIPDEQPGVEAAPCCSGRGGLSL